MSQPERPHRAALREGRVSVPGQPYFITKCTIPSVADALLRPDAALLLIESFRWAREQEWWRILGYVLMPGHYHLIIGLGSVKLLSDALASVDRFTSTHINRLLGRRGHFWEDGFHDHAIRDRRDFDDILEYTHCNPVAAGLAESPEAWPFSTANESFSDDIDREWLSAWIPPAAGAHGRFDPGRVPVRYR